MPDLSDDYPWPTGPWVRALFVISLDGAVAGPDGRSGTISGPADKQVLIAVRRFSDAVVVGAGTMRVERYSPMRVSAEARAERQRRGLAAAPRLVVISRSLDLPWPDPVYAESAVRPLIVTSAGSADIARDRVPEGCDVLVSPSEEVDPRWLLEELASQGLTHVVCEGGPSVLAAFLRARAIDEWALTLSGIVGGQAFAPITARSEGDFVFTRFAREREA